MTKKPPSAATVSRPAPARSARTRPARPILQAPPPEDAAHKIDPSLLGLAVKLSEIRPDPANERVHSRQNLDAIRGSLEKFGQREPLVVNRRTGMIEAGHGRYVAMSEMGWGYAAVVLVDEDAASASGYRVAANRSGELAEWDDEKLLATLKGIGEDELSSVGFTLAELKKIEKDLAPPEPPEARAVTPTFGATVVCPKCQHEWTEKKS